MKHCNLFKPGAKERLQNEPPALDNGWLDNLNVCFNRVITVHSYVGCPWIPFLRETQTDNIFSVLYLWTSSGRVYLSYLLKRQLPYSCIFYSFFLFIVLPLRSLSDVAILHKVTSGPTSLGVIGALQGPTLLWDCA